MSFLDSAAAPEQNEGPPPAAASPPGGGQPNPPQGGGPILAALANRQRGHQVSAPGPGDTASSMSLVQHAIGMLSQALPGLEPGTPIQQDVLKATQRLSKHVQGSATLGSGQQKTHLMDMLASLAKNFILQNIMGQQRGAGGGAGAPQGGGQQSGPPGAMASAPMPSTPLPGA
jgi:hypothetical protein